MGTKRNDSAGEGTHAYQVPNGLWAVRMGDGTWNICRDSEGKHDTGRDYPTLRAARKGET